MGKHVFIEIEDEKKTGVILEKIQEGSTTKYKVQLDEGGELIVDKNRLSKYKLERNYETNFNGRKEDFSETPLERNAVTYYNSLTGKWQTQNYIELDNIIISPMVRINEKTGDFEFALVHKPNASMMKSKEYEGQVWEVPVFSMMKKHNLSKEKMEEIFEEQCMSKYGEEYFGSRKLEDKPTPISQSFTHQLGLFRAILVYYNEDSKLNWYPIESLESLLEKNREKAFTSLQTAYALEMLQDIYKNQISSAKKAEFNIQNNIQANKIKTSEILPRRKIIRIRKYSV